MAWMSRQDSNFSGDNGVLIVGNTVTVSADPRQSTNAKVFFATGWV